MISLVYISTANRHLIDDELLELMASCHRNNKARNVTGMLLYNGMNIFIQALEGDQEVVESLFDTIKQDRRHHDVLCLEKREIQHRDFPDWSMGFRNLANIKPADVEGFSDFMNADFNEPETESLTFARQLLAKVKTKSEEIIF